VATGQVLLGAIRVSFAIYYFNNIPYSSINRADTVGPPEATRALFIASLYN
jgi:hypothetical protein